MRHRRTIITLLLLVILLNGCGDVVEEVQTLGEYDVPFDPQVAQRIYTYVRQPGDERGGDTLVYKFIYDDVGSNRYRQIITENSLLRGEREYEINEGHKKLIAEYIYEDPTEKIACEILQYEGFDVGHRLSGLKYKGRYTNRDGFVTTNSEEDYKISDATEVWNGQERKAVEIDYMYVSKEKIKYLPFIVHTYEYKGKATFVEGIGLFKWTLRIDDTDYVTKLVSVKIRTKKS